MAHDSSVSLGLVVVFEEIQALSVTKLERKAEVLLLGCPRSCCVFWEWEQDGLGAPQISLFEDAENKLCAFKKPQAWEEAPVCLHLRAFYKSGVFYSPAQKSHLSLKDPLGKPSHFSRILSILLHFSQAMVMNISLSPHAVNYDGLL